MAAKTSSQMAIQTKLTIQKNAKSHAKISHSEWSIMRWYDENGTLGIVFSDNHSNDTIHFQIKDNSDLERLKNECEKALATKSIQGKQTI